MRSGLHVCGCFSQLPYLTWPIADDDPKAIKLTADMFKTDKVFNICAYIICILLVVIYTAFF